MKVISLIFLFPSIFHLIYTENYKTGDRPRSIECSVDNSTYQINYCNVKAVSRQVVLINIGFNILRTLKSPIYIHVIYNYRFGTIYREMINSQKVEICSILSGKATNPIIIITIDLLKKAYPDFIHPCPYEIGKIFLLLKTLCKL